MNVKELIEHLQKFPQDAPVIYTFYSDYEEMEPDDVQLIEPDDKGGVICHLGHWMYLRAEWWPFRRTHGSVSESPNNKDNLPERPKMITVVHFKGN